MNPIFDKYSKIIIGDSYKRFLKIPNSKCYSLLTNDECIKFFSESKVMLFPSLCDANPNTVREAYYVNCIPLISNNIGYVDKFPTELVCKSFETKEIFTYSDYLVDAMTAHIDRDRQKKVK